MKAKNRFEKTKIKMVMKLRGLTREAEMRELHIDEPKPEAAVGKSPRSIAREESPISAEEFFGAVEEDDGDWMTAEEFFKA